MFSLQTSDIRTPPDGRNEKSRWRGRFDNVTGSQMAISKRGAMEITEAGVGGAAAPQKMIVNI